MNTGKGKISYVLQTINIVPLLFFGVLIAVLGSHYFTRTMHEEVEISLRNAARNLVTLYDTAYPGDYTLVGDNVYQLYKGEHNLTNDHSLLDKVKADTELDITLFYQDTRVLTTITNSSGSRIVGSGAPSVVMESVLYANEARFYDNVIVGGSNYFAYYMPLHNSDGTVVGMLFVGKPRQSVDASVQHSVYPLLIADVCIMVFIAICMFFYTRSFASILLKIHVFLSSVSSGNLNAELDNTVLRRNDELGDIGRSALNMQRSLRNMVEQDTLTELYNRRSADRRIHQIMDKASRNNTPFCVSIGDIDFFKSINDTYGHDCGDLVLKNIANELRSHMRNIGFAARWGGEEFLLVFDKLNEQEALKSLQDLMEKIRRLESLYEGQSIQVTMTFGLTESTGQELKQLLRDADDKLYAGKAGGRNQIVH